MCILLYRLHENLMSILNYTILINLTYKEQMNVHYPCKTFAWKLSTILGLPLLVDSTIIFPWFCFRFFKCAAFRRNKKSAKAEILLS